MEHAPTSKIPQNGRHETHEKGIYYEMLSVFKHAEIMSWCMFEHARLPLVFTPLFIFCATFKKSIKLIYSL